MNMAISPTGIAGGTPGLVTEQGFKDILKNKSNEDLVQMLGQDNLPPDVEKMIKEELSSRMGAKGGEGADAAGGTGGGKGGGLSPAEADELLKKLKDGSISSDEIKQLAAALKVDVATLEKAKGGGEAALAEGDIAGG